MNIRLTKPERSLATMIVQDQNQGFVAIFFAIAISILLVISTSYASTLQISELNQASTIDSSESAYYAAEAGMEEAARRLDALATGIGADNLKSLGSNFLNTVYPEQYDGFGALNGDQATLIDSSGTSQNNVSIVNDATLGAGEIGRLAWRTRKIYPANNILTGSQVKDETIQMDGSDLRRECPGGPPAGSNGKDCDGTSIFARMGGIEYCYKSNSAEVPQIEVTTVTFDPNNIASSNILKSIVTAGGLNQTNIVNNTPAPTGYSSCFQYHIPLALIISKRHIWRVKVIFQSSAAQVVDPVTGNQSNFSVNYKMSLLGPAPSYDNLAYNSKPVYVPNDTFYIDVVGQSGDVRRRILARKYLHGRLISIFDYVLYSGSSSDALCKAGVRQIANSDNIYSGLCKPVTLP